MEQPNRLVEAEVSSAVAAMLAEHLEVDVAAVCSGVSFVELHPDFDSFAVLHIHNLIEEHFSVTLTLDAEQDAFPMCLQELVALIMRCAPRSAAAGGVPPGLSP